MNEGREFTDDWASLGAELAEENAGNNQGHQIEPITSVRPANSITDKPPASLEGDTRKLPAQVIRLTRAFAPSMERQAPPPDAWSISPPSTTERVLVKQARDTLPISDPTPVRGVNPDDLKKSIPPEALFSHINSTIPPSSLASALRAPTKVIPPDSLVELAATVAEPSIPPTRALASTYHHATILPTPLDESLPVSSPSQPAAQATNSLASIIIEGLPILSSWTSEVQKVIVEDQCLVESTSDRFITDPKAPWWQRLGNKIKETASALSSKVRETLSEIFTFRASTRRTMLAVLAGASLGTITALHHHISKTEAHEEVPVVHIQTTDATIPTTITTPETPVTTSPDQTPRAVHAATVTVGEDSRPITFVQALTQFLTSNAARAQLGSYQHHTGDAVRVLHSLERNTDLAETSHLLRHNTHRGDRFHFAVMNDGSIRLDHWNSRHSQSNKLPGPVTFDLPRR